MREKIFCLLSLLGMVVALGVGCNKAPRYGPTEGPLRAKFQQSTYLVSMDKNTAWTGRIFFDGMLPGAPLHVEGYVNNELRMRSDGPPLTSRMISVGIQTTRAMYCAAIGEPLGRDDPFTRFEPLFPDDYDASDGVLDGTLLIEFRFYEITHPQNHTSKFLTTARTKLKLSCAMCGRCQRPSV